MAENPDSNPHFEDPFENQLSQDPFVEDHFTNKVTGIPYQPSQQPGANWTETLPDSTAVLVLGILSIVGSFCYGIIGLILGIIGLAIASRPQRLYNQNPTKYSQASYGNLKAGKVCAIIGLSISGIFILGVFFFMIAVGLN